MAFNKTLTLISFLIVLGQTDKSFGNMEVMQNYNFWNPDPTTIINFFQSHGNAIGLGLGLGLAGGLGFEAVQRLRNAENFEQNNMKLNVLTALCCGGGFILGDILDKNNYSIVPEFPQKIHYTLGWCSDIVVFTACCNLFRGGVFPDLSRKARIGICAATLAMHCLTGYLVEGALPRYMTSGIMLMAGLLYLEPREQEALRIRREEQDRNREAVRDMLRGIKKLEGAPAA